MNTLLRFAVCVLLIAGPVAAQPGGLLGVYADPAGTVCTLSDPGLMTIQYYVVHNLMQAQASRFKAPVPDCMNGAIFLSDETQWPLKIGLVPDGTLIGYGGCFTGPLHILTINIFAMGMSGECCYYPVLPDPTGVTGQVEVEGCDGQWYAASVFPSVINYRQWCWCEVAAEVTTWGKVKALYTK